MILYNIIKNERARNKPEDDSTISVRNKFPINFPKKNRICSCPLQMPNGSEETP